MKISIVSNDERYIYLNEILNKAGFDSKICEINELDSPEVVILSVRKEHSDKELEEIFSRVSPTTLVLSPYSVKNPNCLVYDYTRGEAFLKKNAYLTAEGAICLYYNTVKKTLQGKKIAVLGYGRIGKYLSKMLKNQGASLNVLTASPHSCLDVCLKRLNVYDLFDNVWSCDDFNTSKSNPEIYNMAAERLGLSVEDVVFIDDNVNAVKTAKQAGMLAYGIYDDSSKDSILEMQKIADKYLQNLKELI